MSCEYVVSEHDVDFGRCKVMAKLQMSQMQKEEDSPSYRILVMAGKSNYQLKHEFREGTKFTVKNGHPVVDGKVYEDLTLKAM